MYCKEERISATVAETGSGAEVRVEVAMGIEELVLGQDFDVVERCRVVRITVVLEKLLVDSADLGDEGAVANEHGGNGDVDGILGAIRVEAAVLVGDGHANEVLAVDRGHLDKADALEVVEQDDVPLGRGTQGRADRGRCRLEGAHWKFIQGVGEVVTAIAIGTEAGEVGGTPHVGIRELRFRDGRGNEKRRGRGRTRY